MERRYAEWHKYPAGPGDHRPTGEQIVREEDLEGKFHGKNVLITGCSSGIGTQTARAIFLTGATLYLTARDLGKARLAVGDIARSARVHFIELHLDSLNSVRSCAANFLSKNKTLNVLICNAGLMTPERLETEDGFEMHFGANYLAHFLLFSLLRPALESAAATGLASRVVLLSSIVHRFAEIDFTDIALKQGYDGMKAYGASKTAMIWMSNEIERRFGADGIHAWSVHPGAVLSELNRNMSDEQSSALATNPHLAKLYKDSKQGAASSVWAAIGKALEGQGGGYIEDVQVAKAWAPDVGQWGPGYAPHALNTEKSKMLWEQSCKLLEVSTTI